MSLVQTKSGRFFLLAVVLLATMAVYARTINYGLIGWDEPLAGVGYYQETPELAGLAEILKPKPGATYQPVRTLAMTILAPFGAESNWLPYHAVTLLFYLATVAVFYLVALRLLVVMGLCPGRERAAPWALLATAIFAVHPSHAEAVAWVTGHKDTFVAFFYLAALHFYIRRDRLGATDAILTVIMFLLALGSKPSAVSLPLVLVAYDFLLRGDNNSRNNRVRLLLYIVLFVPALAAVVYFAGTTARVGSLLVGAGALPGKGVKFLAAHGFSVLKLLLPVNLCLRYPGFSMNWSDPSLYLYTSVGAAVIVWAVQCIRRRSPYAFVAAWFILAMLPNSNLIRIQIERADRYYYLSSAAFAVASAAGLLQLSKMLAERYRQIFRYALAGMLLVLSAVCWKQAGYWSDPVNAWSRVFNLYPEMTLARLGLASSYLRSGELDEALRYYKPLLEGDRPNTEAIKGAMYISEQRNNREQMVELAKLGRRFDPDNDDFLSALCRYYFIEQDTAAVREVVDGWNERSPNNKLLMMNKALLLQMEGDQAQAEEVYGRLIGKYPYLPEPYIELGDMKTDAGQYARAEELYRQALATGIRTTVTRHKLASFYEKTGRGGKALEIYSRYDKDELSMSGLEFMGAHCFGRGELEKSLDYFQQMARRDSTMARAWSNSAVVLQELGRLERADSLYQRAIGLDSSYVDAFFNRGNLLMQLDRPAEAAALYGRADSLAGGIDLAVLGSLANALAAAGDTAAAQSVVRRIRELDSGGEAK